MFNESAFLRIAFWALVLSSMIVPAAIYIAMVVKERISRITVFAFGMLLILLSAVDLFLLQHLMNIAGQTPSLLDDKLFKSEFSLALYLLPLISAAVGTNLISHVLERHLEEAERRLDRQREREAERERERERHARDRNGVRRRA